MNVVITGAGGQTGSYLKDYMSLFPYRVTALTRRDVDLTDPDAVARAVASLRPDRFLNLAAQSSASESLSRSTDTFLVNYAAVTNILAALHLHTPKCRFFNAGSCYEFSSAKTPYSESKQWAREVVKHYRQKKGMFAVQGTLFPHSSERQSTRFLLPKIVRRAAIIVRACQEHRRFDPLTLGDSSARLTLCHARDVAIGIWKMVNMSEPDDYELAGNETVSVKQLAEWAFESAGLKVNDVERGTGGDEIFTFGDRTVAVHDASLDRPSQQVRSSAANLLPGWEPQTTVRQMVVDMVNFNIQALTPPSL